MKLSMVLSICLFLLSACGGGSSSSGSGSNDGGAGNSSQFDGTYIGTSEINAMALGQAIRVTGPITVVIENGNVIYSDDEGNRIEVPINGQGQFSGTNDDSAIISDGSIESCEGTATLNGTANPPEVSGTIEGSGSCTIDGQNVAVTYTTTFTATRQ